MSGTHLRDEPEFQHTLISLMQCLSTLFPGLGGFLPKMASMSVRTNGNARPFLNSRQSVKLSPCSSLIVSTGFDGARMIIGRWRLQSVRVSHLTSCELLMLTG